MRLKDYNCIGIPDDFESNPEDKKELRDNLLYILEEDETSEYKLEDIRELMRHYYGSTVLEFLDF